MAAARDLVLPGNTILPARLFQIRFSRSGGPGGQNVNKLNTKVDLRLDLASAQEFLGAERYQRACRRLASRLDADGRLQIVSSEHRERERNIDAAYARMRMTLVEAMRAPRTRRPTRPTRASKERRLEEKRRRSQIKRSRRDRWD